MNNREYVLYIHCKLLECLQQDVALVESKTEGQVNDNFVAIFDVNGIQLSFVKDRGFLNGEILKGGNYTPFWKLHKSLTNIWLEGTKNIDFIVDFLAEHKDEIFKEE